MFLPTRENNYLLLFTIKILLLFTASLSYGSGKPDLVLLSDYHEDIGQVRERVRIINKMAKSMDILLLEGHVFDPKKPVRSDSDLHVRLLVKSAAVFIQSYGWEEKESFEAAQESMQQFQKVFQPWAAKNDELREFFIREFQDSDKTPGEVRVSVPLPEAIYKLCQEKYFEGVIEKRNKSLRKTLQSLARTTGSAKTIFVVIGKAHINEDLVSALAEDFNVVIPEVPATTRHVVLDYIQG